MQTTPKQYQSLIDQETWSFISRTESWYPPDAIEFSIEKQREIYNAMCGEFYQGHPAGITTDNRVLHATDCSVPVRHYYNDDAQGSGHAGVVYFHGGGFVVGGLDSHDDVCGEISAVTGIPVTSVDYRLSPEHPHPAAFNDSMAVVEALSVNSDLILCGDSAGGNLAASVCHAMRGKPQVAGRLLGQVLIYPGLGGDTMQGSYITHANAPMLSTQDVKFYSQIRTGGNQITGDPKAAPLHDTDFSGLPPTVVVSAECDPLSDDGKHYCEKLRQSGGRAVWHCEAGLVHGFLRARTTVTRARNSFDRILKYVEQLAASKWE